MPSTPSHRRNVACLPVLSVIFISFMIIVWMHSIDLSFRLSQLSNKRKSKSMHVRVQGGNRNYSINIPSELFGTVYHTKDFKNKFGVIPPFWGKSGGGPSSNPNNDDNTWGPCYARGGRINWAHEMSLYHEQHQYPKYHSSDILAPKVGSHNVQDYCRPGFLIIGQGKCGTSSLYHYLTEHPRVLPASEKQIHYFKYYTNLPLKWYYSHFPTATTFLASGALMTGEASPGYIPYPDVPLKIAEMMPGPKIILIGRDPIERAYSSYRYNYVNPTVDKMRKGSVLGIRGRQSEQYYKDNYIFTFEQMIRAELKTLKRCLQFHAKANTTQHNNVTDPIGYGIKFTEKQWSNVRPYGQEMKRRKDQNERPLVDVDGTCYGGKYSHKILRYQWKQLMEEYPERKVVNSNVHLVQAMLGRSLYVLPLEFWYLIFNKSDIYFMCTEELQDKTGSPLNEVSAFLGLPQYENFSSVVSQGVYNVGGHRGYDNEISWDELAKTSNTIYKSSNSSSSSSAELLPEQDVASTKKKVPLPDDLIRELQDFFHPYNEDLFKLTGRRCQWGY